MPSLVQVDNCVFTVAHVFTAEECRALIARAEAIGFEPAAVRTSAGPQMMTNVRNNDRVSLVDPALANDMWRRVSDLLPVLDGARACGADPHLRFYRYQPGQQFKRHKDGSVTDAQGRSSKLSYLIYLNDCAGGGTVFHEFHEVDGVRTSTERLIQPAEGMALLFRHERWHEGTPVTAGRKYVLRTDIFYE